MGLILLRSLMGCNRLSNRQNQSIAKLALPPVVTVNNIDANSFCNPAVNGDGSVSLTVNNANGDIQPKTYVVSNIVSPLAGYTTVEILLAEQDCLERQKIFRDFYQHRTQ